MARIYFNLVAGNGQTIGTSETYATSSGANAGVTAVMSAVTSAASASSSAKAGPKFETFTGSDGKSYFHLRAQNGQIVLQSQAYSSKSSASSGISSVESNGADASNYRVIEGQNGQFTAKGAKLGSDKRKRPRTPSETVYKTSGKKFRIFSSEDKPLNPLLASLAVQFFSFAVAPKGRSACRFRPRALGEFRSIWWRLENYG